MVSRPGGTLGLNVALIGVSGAGKTTVAPLAAARLGFPWVDLDAAIVAASGRTAASFFEAGEEAAFRVLEREALERALAGRRPGVILACGGGLVTAPETRALLRARAFVVWLKVSHARALARLGSGGIAERPLLAGDAPEALERLLRERAPLYEGAADAVIDTDGLTPDDVAERVAALCRPDPTWP
ncbi:MAG TPA: shikimate kinase [Candidatus Eisenbacteria bacterium]|nr:shikimate kinase [Candidatus Eisenbacteria bacterium]